MKSLQVGDALPIMLSVVMPSSLVAKVSHPNASIQRTFATGEWEKLPNE
jgi:hypothetical protein